ncbi:hypothetical protein DFR24_0025 [Panacagrimonas perspica]|uniref:Uncharacterized protein n=1 Tax=Panacagrimonas perspica TaxID=381431 RepID=A0A4V3F622_9GAMM|nr:hypothetical protein [Panacagrimonas perspica]TDU30676.1 hypothetical protein DFR24_0025 [Panacagrimonas perspica]THD01509.1 hypothetical protein B1810_18445 [Panacagrimonas perspica]
MKIEEEIHHSFCEAYADAVLRFVKDGVNGDVVFDESAKAFVAKTVAANVPPMNCDWWVGDDWPSFVGPLACRTNASSPKFNEKMLHDEIVFALTKSTTGKRMSRILAGLD